MIDERYKNAFREVNDILENTDEELFKKIPDKFINFIKNNMNKSYKANIQTQIDINEQKLLPESEDILSLIYISYWATDKEKEEYIKKNKEEFIKREKNKIEKYNGKSIEDLFKRRESSEQKLNKSLMIIEKEGVVKRIINKIKKYFGIK